MYDQSAEKDILVMVFGVGFIYVYLFYIETNRIFPTDFKSLSYTYSI